MLQEKGRAILILGILFLDDGSHVLPPSTSLRSRQVRTTFDEREKPQQFRKK